MRAPVPLEDEEAYVFADWLRAMKIPHTHIANEIGGSTRTTKLRAMKAKRMGQTAGVWDYEIFIPVKNIDGEIEAYQEIRIELKRRRGGTVSPAQREWEEIYEMAGIPCQVCRGAEEAINFVKSMEKSIHDN